MRILFSISIKLNLFSFFFFNVVSKGVGVNLLKVGSKRRRTMQEIKDQKQEVELKKEAMEQKLAQID